MSNTIVQSALLKQYQTIRKRSEQLCEPLNPEDYIPQSAVFASPPKWHLAHTTWFFEEMILTKNYPNYELFDAKFSYLFNSYYNTVGQRIERAERGLITKPDVATVALFLRPRKRGKRPLDRKSLRQRRQKVFFFEWYCCF